MQSDFYEIYEKTALTFWHETTRILLLSLSHVAAETTVFM